MVLIPDNKEKICKNCRYYNESSFDCICPKFIYTGYDDDIDYEGDEFGYWDCDSYSAGFNVGKKFGCVHFKGK